MRLLHLISRDAFSLQKKAVNFDLILFRIQLIGNSSNINSLGGDYIIYYHVDTK